MPRKQSSLSTQLCWSNRDASKGYTYCGTRELSPPLKYLIIKSPCWDDGSVGFTNSVFSSSNCTHSTPEQSGFLSQLYGRSSCTLWRWVLLLSHGNFLSGQKPQNPPSSRLLHLGTEKTKVGTEETDMSLGSLIFTFIPFRWRKHLVQKGLWQSQSRVQSHTGHSDCSLHHRLVPNITVHLIQSADHPCDCVLHCLNCPTGCNTHYISYPIYLVLGSSDNLQEIYSLYNSFRKNNRPFF